jgi:hypothetical protein
VAAGLIGRDGDALTVYREDEGRALKPHFLRVLKEMNVRETAAAVGADPSTITRIRRGTRLPHEALRRALEREIARYARARLREGGVTVPLDDDAAVRLYARLSEQPF